MTRTSTYNRIVMTLTLLSVALVAYCTHDEHNNIISAITTHQQHTISAFAQLNTTIAKGIEKRAEAQIAKDQLQIREQAIPTPTPQVITKTKTRTRYLRPSPKPFKLFGQ